LNAQSIDASLTANVDTDPKLFDVAGAVGSLPLVGGSSIKHRAEWE